LAEALRKRANRARREKTRAVAGEKRRLGSGRREEKTGQWPARREDWAVPGEREDWAVPGEKRRTGAVRKIGMGRVKPAVARGFFR